MSGGVGAGNPQYEDDGGDPEYLPLPAEKVSRADVFVAEVRGDSMAGDDLRTGDHVIVDPHAQWNEAQGDMVVVVDEGALLVKRLWHEGDCVTFSSNPPIRRMRRLFSNRDGNILAARSSGAR